MWYGRTKNPRGCTKLCLLLHNWVRGKRTKRMDNGKVVVSDVILI